MVELKEDGLSNQDICRVVSANEVTLYRWLKTSRAASFIAH